MEELKGSLGVFEKVLPDFFAGAVDHLSQIRNDTYTVNKKQMTDAAREYLANETALKLEYDLYNHAKGIKYYRPCRDSLAKLKRDCSSKCDG